MKIATWNVNSIRTRLEQVSQWLQDNPVEVLCLQETKVVDELFPQAPFLDLGYQVYISGQKAYNGVAILSREPVESVTSGFSPVLGDVGELDAQKRLITGIVRPGLRVVNVYIPNGSALGSEKYEYKLAWLNTLKTYLARLQVETGEEIIICGDFNIAPEDIDIHDPTGRETHIMATDAEREALETIAALGFQDSFRKFTTEPGYYSWWDYRTGAFRRNQGWRIDHHYVTAGLYAQARSCVIDTAPRKLEKPSDHAPVILELAGSLEG